jgi:hypothetical protein
MMKQTPHRSAGPLFRRVIDEPLAQFFAIGLALFAVDRLMAEEAVDPRRIVVDRPAYAEMVGEFAAVAGRAPEPPEMERLAEQWIMNETLYREARALRLDEGDEMIRERVMQKLRVLMHGAITVPEPDDDTLRAYFEENRARYDQPDRVSFRLAQIDGAREEAEALAERMNAAFRGDLRLAPGEVNVFPFPERPRPVLEQVFGEEMVAAIIDLPEETWTPIETPLGWQAAFFESFRPGSVADFETIRNAVAAEWQEFERRRSARAAIEALMASYRIERAPYDPGAFDDAVAQAIADAQGESTAFR